MRRTGNEIVENWHRRDEQSGSEEGGDIEKWGNMLSNKGHGKGEKGS